VKTGAKVRPIKKQKMTQAAMHRFIHACRGSVKRQPGEKPFNEWRAEHKAEEIALEEAKLKRCFGSDLPPRGDLRC
jgi:hypothetical protein